MGLFSLIGGIIGGNKQAKATRRAAQLQYDAAMAGIDETRRQFDLTRADFASEQQLGEDGIGGFRRLVGLDGAEAQQAEIDALRASPLYQSIFNNGRDTILATASATGGLRGGNTQDALARFGGDALSQVIRQQLSDYAGTIGIGMGSDQAIGNFGAAAVRDINDSRNAGAGAMAQSALVRGGIAAQNWANAGSFLDNGISAALGGGNIRQILSKIM
jgi:hypothetical protein